MIDVFELLLVPFNFRLLAAIALWKTKFLIIFTTYFYVNEIPAFEI